MNLTLYPLGDYIQLLQKEGLLVSAAGAPLTREVALVSCDSRQVAPGTLFICKGAHFKEEFLRAALGAGAFAYLAEKPYGDVDAPCLQVTDVRSAMALLADFYYNHPSSKHQGQVLHHLLPQVYLRRVSGRQEAGPQRRHLLHRDLRRGGEV